jgi:LysM repeat protein
MRQWKRLFYYLIINVFVSACTVVTVLTLWQRYQPEIPFIGDVNPLALITPISPQSLFPDYVSAAETPEPTAVAIQATPETLPTVIEMSEMSYTVETGDTLGAIAVKFNVTVAEITAANEISNPDALEVGQVLIIRRPLIAVSTHTALPPEEIETEIEATSTLPTNTPVPLTGESAVMIDSVIGAGDLASERVFLKRVGPGEISLTGWELVAENGETFIFPQLILFESGAVFIHTKEGQTTAVALYWGLDHAVWKSGETVVLIDDQGEVHSSYQIP